MRKISIFCLVLLSFLSSAFGEVKLDTLLWLDSEAYVDTEDDILVDKGGAFYIGRAYVNLRGDIAKDWFGSKITGRLTADLTKPSTPIKYAYFDWKFVDFLVFSAGIVKSEFGYLTYWEYPIPVKHFTDMDLKPTASADFGIGLSGKLLSIEGLTKNLIYYNLQILNGEGYEALYKGDTTPANAAFASQYTLILSPFNGIKIGGTYRVNPFDSKNSRPYSLTNQKPLRVNSDAYSFYLYIKDLVFGNSENGLKIPIDFLFEYANLNTTYDGYEKLTSTKSTNFTRTGYGYTIVLGYNIFNVVTPYLRFDFVDKDISETATNDMNQIIYIGANIKADPKGNLVVKPLYQYYLMKDNKSDKNDWIAKLEFEYKIGFSIWQ